MFRQFILFVALLASVAFGKQATAPSLKIDQPLSFKTVREFWDYTISSKPSDIDPAFAEALTYIDRYALQHFPNRTYSEQLLLRLINQQTPRHLMILGFTLRLELLRRSIVEDELRIARREPLSAEENFEECEKLYRHRISECKVFENYYVERINALVAPLETAE